MPKYLVTIPVQFVVEMSLEDGETTRDAELYIQQLLADEEIEIPGDWNTTGQITVTPYNN